MSDEIKEILDKAKEISSYGSDGKQHTRMFNQFEAKALLDYITNLQQENHRLNNIINELEKWLEDKLFNKTNFNVDEAIENLAYSKVLDKLKELKENNNECKRDV